MDVMQLLKCPGGFKFSLPGFGSDQNRLIRNVQSVRRVGGSLLLPPPRPNGHDVSVKKLSCLPAFLHFQVVVVADEESVSVLECLQGCEDILITRTKGDGN